MKPILPSFCLQICLLGSPQKAAPEAEVTKEAIALTHIYFLATAVILWPAWWFGLVVPYAFIPLAWLYEKLKSGKVYPSLIVIGSLIIIEGTLSGLFLGSPGVQKFTKWFYHLFV